MTDADNADDLALLGNAPAQAESQKQASRNLCVVNKKKLSQPKSSKPLKNSRLVHIPR